MSPIIDPVPVAAGDARANGLGLLTGLSSLLSPPAVESGDAESPWRRIFVGMLTRVSPHPNADREVVVEVDAGWGRLTVVTGGPHVEVGRKVAVALPGARVVDVEAAAPRLRKLKKERVRGVMSEGMLCSAKELGISDDHSSIYLLAADAPIGVALAEWLRI